MTSIARANAHTKAGPETKDFLVRVVMNVEHLVNIVVPAASQDEADQLALAKFDKDLGEMRDTSGLYLGLLEPWDEIEPFDSDAQVNKLFRCVDCSKDTMENDYYSVENEVWLAAGMKIDPMGDDGMLCIACLERRLGRPLTLADFMMRDDGDRILPKCWDRHLAQREARHG